MWKYFIIRLMRQKTFYIALLVGVTLSLLYIYFDVYPYTNSSFMHTPYSIWMGSFTASIFSSLFYMLVPIIVVISTSGIYVNDKNSGYLNSIIACGKKKKYFKNLYMFNFVVSGFCYLVPILINLYFCFILLPNNKIDLIVNETHNVALYGNDTLFPALYYSNPFLHICIYMSLGFIVSGIFASIALASSFYLKHVFFVWLSAFIINFLYETILTIIVSESPSKLFPLSFIQQVGNHVDVSAIISVLLIGFSIPLVIYLWGVNKRVVN